MMYTNEMQLQFLNKSANEGFARVSVAAFISQLDITLEELSDIKTAVSEAVTNAIVHGYADTKGYITLSCKINDNRVEISVSDCGRGIEDVAKAREPLYTTQPDMERSGMGFTVMETFMDKVDVKSALGRGTTVTMEKTVGNS